MIQYLKQMDVARTWMTRLAPQGIKGLILSMMLIAYGFMCAMQPAYADHGKKVLLINSYHPHYQWTDDITRGVVDALASVVPPEDIYVEYMDARRHIDDTRLLDNFHNLIAYKYRKVNPALIIVSDDPALNYMLTQGRELFPDVPIVFSGINAPEKHNFDAVPDITGIVEGVEIDGNLQLMLQVLPNTKRIVMLSDHTSIGGSMARRARAVIQAWKDDPDKPKIEMEVWQDFSMHDLEQALTRMPSDTAVLFLAVHEDNQGHYFSYRYDLEQITSLSAVPVWGMWGSSMLGHGVIGGMMNNGYSHGGVAGKLASEVLQGKPLDQIPIIYSLQSEGGYKPQFDYTELERFHVSEDRLPEHSIIIHKPVGFMDKHPQVVYGGTVVFAFLSLVIAVLVVNIRRRAASEMRLDNMNRNLEKIVELRTSELNERNRSLQRLNQDMKDLAHTDHLTGLGNRRSASEKLDTLMQISKSTSQSLVISMVDVDHFKNINDTYGHDVGDEALKLVSRVLNSGLRPNDTAFRWGGEEFLLILVNTELEAARVACDRLRKAVSATKTVQGYTLNISIGLAEYRSGEDARTFLHRADDALYAAKTGGRNRVVVSE